LSIKKGPVSEITSYTNDIYIQAIGCNYETKTFSKIKPLEWRILCRASSLILSHVWFYLVRSCCLELGPLRKVKPLNYLENNC